MGCCFLCGRQWLASRQVAALRRKTRRLRPRLGTPLAKTPAQRSEPWLSKVGNRIETGMYRLLADEAGFRAHSLEEGLQARFDQRGVHISNEGVGVPADEGEVTLHFSAWGRVGAERDVEPGRPVLGACNDAGRVDEHGDCVKRLELVRDGVVEWWDNTSRGLQQAWTIADRPAGSGRIQLLVDVEARLQARAPATPLRCGEPMARCSTTTSYISSMRADEHSTAHCEPKRARSRSRSMTAAQSIRSRSTSLRANSGIRLSLRKSRLTSGFTSPASVM